MKLRNSQFILRIHSSSKKQADEGKYSELLVHYPWDSEYELRKNFNLTYNDNYEEIKRNKQRIYPNSKMKEKKVTNIFKFIQQSRQEASKIVWPTRRETITTTIMVFIMVTILSIFFLITDSIISFLLRILLSLSF